MDKNGKTSVFIYNKVDKIVRLKDVKVVEMSLDGSAVVEGLQLGEQVVATGVHYLVDGQKAKGIRN